MKKAIFLLLAMSMANAAFAQTTGEGASAPAKAAQSNSWQYWVFGASAVAMLAVGVAVVSMHQGSTPHAH